MCEQICIFLWTHVAELSIMLSCISSRNLSNCGLWEWEGKFQCDHDQDDDDDDDDDGDSPPHESHFEEHSRAVFSDSFEVLVASWLNETLETSPTFLEIPTKTSSVRVTQIKVPAF